MGPFKMQNRVPKNYLANCLPNLALQAFHETSPFMFYFLLRHKINQLWIFVMNYGSNMFTSYFCKRNFFFLLKLFVLCFYPRLKSNLEHMNNLSNTTSQCYHQRKKEGRKEKNDSKAS